MTSDLKSKRSSVLNVFLPILIFTILVVGCDLSNSSAKVAEIDGVIINNDLGNDIFEIKCVRGDDKECCAPLVSVAAVIHEKGFGYFAVIANDDIEHPEFVTSDRRFCNYKVQGFKIKPEHIRAKIFEVKNYLRPGYK